MSPIEITIENDDLDLARSCAKAFELGGRSFRDPESRQDNLEIDQLVGALGEMAFALYLTGETHLWKLTKWARLSCFTQGDNGEDVLGLNVDVKTSLIRSPTLPPEEHRLGVREEEMRDDTVYIGCLIPHLSDKKAVIQLNGWAQKEDFPEIPITEGPWQGAYCLPMLRLRKLPPFRWFKR
jgi:hypothetical protein|tara:strand:- start:338 stop:880 length:543 start_codon:yes stop_codon:yes gene_type:complete